MLVAVALVALVASCADDEADDGDGGASPVTTVDLPTAEFTLADHTISGPATLPAGTTRVTAVNQGAETHHLVFTRLEPGAEPADFALAFARLSPGGVGTMVGGPTSIAPGASGTATVVLTPGEYVVSCFVPSPDGVSHFLKGMTTELTVTPSDATTSLPPADRTVHLSEFTIGRDGDDLDDFDATGTVEVTNEGAELHELALIRLAEDATIDDAVDVASTPIGQPRPTEPWTSIGGVSLLSTGESAEFDLDELDLDDGRYAFICFIPSPDDRVAHAAKGMTWEFEVPTG